MRNVWEDMDCTKGEVEEAIDRVAQLPEMTKGSAEGTVTNKLSYSIPLELAVEKIFYENDAAHLINHEYESFSEWDGELPPPKVDEWVTFNQSDGQIDIQNKVSDLVSPIRSHYVYCIQVEFNHPSLQSLERQSNVVFGEVPTWLRTAWDSEIALYVGYTASFSERVVAHSVGRLADGNPPAMVTALADVVGAGVVERTADKEYALDVEEKYAENLRSVAGEDSVAVYQY